MTLALTSAAFLALSKVTGDAADRDSIPDGSAYSMTAVVRGEINGNEFELPIDCTMAVGHESIRASSVNPKINEVVAAILSKLNAATRASVQREILEGFTATGDVEATDEATAEAERFLAALRRRVDQVVRGSVKFTNLVEPSIEFDNEPAVAQLAAA